MGQKFTELSHSATEVLGSIVVIGCTSQLAAPKTGRPHWDSKPIGKGFPGSFRKAKILPYFFRLAAVQGPSDSLYRSLWHLFNLQELLCHPKEIPVSSHLFLKKKKDCFFKWWHLNSPRPSCLLIPLWVTVDPKMHILSTAVISSLSVLRWLYLFC